jgi:rhodanese-related sulfurtransferase
MPTEIRREEVQRLLDAQPGTQLLDVLSFDEYKKSHLAGAINIPLESLDGETTAHLDRQRPLIVYCYDIQ